MKKIKDFLVIALVAIIVATFVGGVLYYEHSIWSECRQDKSWSYCTRVLSK